jgi:hypothetical protein
MPAPDRICIGQRDFRAEVLVSDWKFAQKDASEELASLSYFSFKKSQKLGDVVFLITVKEYISPPKGQFARFFAQADKHVNQKIAPILPTGWGNSVLDALNACIHMIREFPYEGEQTSTASGASGG